MSPYLPFIIVAIFVAAIALNVVFHRRATRLLHEWCRRNDLKLVSYHRSWLRRGFMWRSSDAHAVFRITVEAPEGLRSGWVRCGGWLLGPYVDKVVVRWD